MKKELLIGKQYMPLDNSYMVNLSNRSFFASLGGIPYKNKPAEVCVIKSDPFDVIITEHESNKTHSFILVETERNETYFVLYHSFRVITKETTIELLKQRDEERNIDMMTNRYY